MWNADLGPLLSSPQSACPNKEAWSTLALGQSGHAGPGTRWALEKYPLHEDRVSAIPEQCCAYRPCRVALWTQPTVTSAPNQMAAAGAADSREAPWDPGGGLVGT